MRKQTEYNKLVAERNGEFYFCDYIFKHKDDFKGATGTELVPVSKEEYEERTSLESITERFEDCWRDAVSNGDEFRSLDDYCSDIFQYEGDEAVFDFSGYNLWDQLREIGYDEENYPVFDCIGGGRCFSKDDKWDKIYDEKLLKKIVRIES